MNLHTVQVGPWKVSFGDHELLPQDVIADLETFLTGAWKPAFLATIQHHWWSSKNRNIPSPLIRVDMAPTRLSESATLLSHIYEVETRPAGLGMATIAPWNGTRERVFEGLKSSLKDCTAFIRTQDSHIQDDYLCAQLIGVPFHNVNGTLPEIDSPVWVRSAVAKSLEPFSLGPVTEDGEKEYMISLGLARDAHAEPPDFSTAFVIKPKRGTWARDIYAYAPKAVAKRFGINGTVTASRICRELDKDGAQFILQPLILPQTKEIHGNVGYTIWRLMFGWIDGRYQFIAGFWNWRPRSGGLKIHGACDAVFGTAHVV